MEPPAHLEQAAAQLEPQGRLVAVHELTGGVSAEVVGLEIATGDGGHRRAVYRRHRTSDVKQHEESVAAKEHRLLAALRALGLPVPEPYLRADAGDGGSPYLLMEWVEGSTDVPAADLSSALDQMVTFLVALHAIVPSSLALPPLPVLEDPIASLPPLLPATPAGDRVRAELEAGTITVEPRPPVLVHGDYWPGNVIWRDGRLVAVIDWEDACLGDPLSDLATARVELLCQHGPAATEAFTTAYLAQTAEASGPPPASSLRAWDLYVSAAALASMASWGLPPVEEARRRRHTEAFFDRAALAGT
jgi:aminoglycoside phosphotransferase (APT) family kinase protein